MDSYTQKGKDCAMGMNSRILMLESTFLRIQHNESTYGHMIPVPSYCVL